MACASSSRSGLRHATLPPPRPFAAKAALDPTCEDAEEAGDVLAALKDFVEDHNEAGDLHPETTYRVFTARGRMDMYIFFAEERGDHTRIAEFQAQRGQWEQLVQLLLRLPKKDAEPLIYTHSPSLVLHAPVSTFSAWRQSPFIQPLQLIPALTVYARSREIALAVVRALEQSGKAPAAGKGKGAAAAAPPPPSAASESVDAQGDLLGEVPPPSPGASSAQQAVEDATGILGISPQVWQGPDLAIQFLQFLVQPGGGRPRNRDTALHNLLMKLHAQHSEEQELIAFLQQELTDRDGCVLDKRYALRVCARHARKEACAHLYSSMGLHEEAVRLALSVSVDLAVQCVQPVKALEASTESRILLRRLYRLIVLHVLSQGGGSRESVAEAIRLVHDSKVLSVEDILPILPGTTKIDEVKGAIEASLARSTQTIEGLRDGMKVLTGNADKIGEAIRELRARYAVVSSDQRCVLSGVPVLGSPMYVFPTGNVYRADALAQFVVPHLPAKTRKQLHGLQGSISQTQARLSSARAAMERRGAGAAVEADEEPAAKRVERLAAELQGMQAELDELVAGDDPLCGELVIDTIDTPFGKAPGEELWCRLDWQL